MKDGSPAVIVSSGKVYQLKGDTAAAEPVLDCAWTVQDIAEIQTLKKPPEFYLTLETRTALGVGSLRRRRSNEERKCREAPGTNRLQGGRYCRHNPNGARQRLRNGWLDDQMSCVAKGTIGLNRLILGVRVRNLNNAGKGKESTAEEAQSNPQ
jgi:hypothetical protein